MITTSNNMSSNARFRISACCQNKIIHGQNSLVDLRKAPMPKLTHKTYNKDIARISRGTKQLKTFWSSLIISIIPVVNTNDCQKNFTNQWLIRRLLRYSSINQTRLKIENVTYWYMKDEACNIYSTGKMSDSFLVLQVWTPKMKFKLFRDLRKGVIFSPS